MRSRVRVPYDMQVGPGSTQSRLQECGGIRWLVTLVPANQTDKPSSQAMWHQEAYYCFARDVGCIVAVEGRITARQSRFMLNLGVRLENTPNIAT